MKQDEQARAGVALIVKEDKMKYVKNEKFVNERILTVNLKEGRGKEEHLIIIAYGPNENEKKEEKDKFYQDLQREIDDSKCNVIMMGDLNGRVGNDNKGIEWCLGKQGEKVKNTNGERLLNFCVENELIIANSHFKHREIHKITRVMESRQEKSIIDYFIASKNIWRKIKDVKVKRGPEIGSDHFLLMMKWENENSNTGERQKRKIVNRKIRCYKLREPQNREKYQKILQQRMKNVNTQESTEQVWNNFKRIILETAEQICGTTKIMNTQTKRTHWWSEMIKEATKRKKKAEKNILVRNYRKTMRNIKRKEGR